MDMKMLQERQELIEYGKKLVTHGLTKGTGGNLSIYCEKEGIMIITPSGMDFFRIQEEDMVLMDREGSLVEGFRKPSSEWQMHLELYKARKDIHSVIHAHTTFATVLACLRWSLPPTHYMIAVAGPDVPCADYATYGTKELAENAIKAMKDRKAVLLANHGILAGSEELADAFNIVEEIEYCAELYYRAKSIGEPVLLEEQEMTKMLDKFGTYFRK